MNDELTPEEFARGVNEAIRALRAVYGGVRALLAELGDELKRRSPPLYDVGARVKPVTTNESPDERFLRTWEGRIYSAARQDEDDDDQEQDGGEDEDDEKGAGGYVAHTAGQDLAFAKVVLYHRDVQEAEPHLICGVLRNVRIEAGDPAFQIPRASFRKVLELISSDVKLHTELIAATVKRPPNLPKSKRAAYKLKFQLNELPVRLRLFDLNSREDVQRIAIQLTAMASPGRAAQAISDSLR